MPITKGKLKPEDQSLLSRNWTYILENIDAKYVVEFFMDEGIFNLDDSEKIRCRETAMERNREFLKILCESGPNAFQVFKDVLTKHGYEYVVHKIETTLPVPEVPEKQKTPGEVLLDSLTEEEKSHRMNEKDLIYFTKVFAKGIFVVTQSLNFTAVTLEQIQMSKPHSGLPQHIHELLVKWKNKNGKAATLGKLLEAFIDASEKTDDINWDEIDTSVKKILNSPCNT